MAAIVAVALSPTPDFESVVASVDCDCSSVFEAVFAVVVVVAVAVVVVFANFFFS